VQLAFTPKTVFIIALIAGAAWFGYATFLQDVQTDDVPELIRIHRDAVAAKKLIVKERILAVYDKAKDYQTLYEAIDDESSITQALAIRVLTAKGEEEALGKLVDTLLNGNRVPDVDAALAEAMGAFHDEDAVVPTVPKLIEMTEDSRPHEMRKAAHDALVAILESGAQVKFGTGMAARWQELWRTHRKHKKWVAQRKEAQKANKSKPK